MGIEQTSKPSVPSRARIATRWAQWILTHSGLIAICYVGLILADANIFQIYERWRFRQTLTNAVKSAEGTEQSTLGWPEASAGEITSNLVPLPEGQPLGQLQSAAIGL